MTQASLEDAIQRAKDFQKQVQDIRLHYQGQALENITVSVGVSSFPEHGKEISHLLKAAETALLNAKKKGRNQFAVARNCES